MGGDQIHIPAKDRKQRNTEMSAENNQSPATMNPQAYFSANKQKAKERFEKIQNQHQEQAAMVNTQTNDQQEGARPAGQDEEDMVVTKL